MGLRAAGSMPGSAGDAVATVDHGAPLAVRGLIPWAVLGCAEALIRLLNLEPPRTSAAVVVVAVGLTWSVALRVLAARSPSTSVALGGLVGLGALTILGTTPWLGRDSLLVAVGGVLVLDAALYRRSPSLPWHRRGATLAPVAVLLLVVAGYRWVTLAPLSTVLALIGLAYVVALVPVPGAVGRAIRRGRASMAAAAKAPAMRAPVRLLRRPAVRTWTAIALLGATVAALWSPVIWRLVHDGDATRVLGINDYPLHVQLAGELSLVPYVNNAPHFLFHLSTAAWHLVFSLEVAAVLAICTAIALSFVAAVILLNQRRVAATRVPLGMAVAVALWFFLAESPGLFALWWGAVPATSPIYTLHWWANPTWLTSMAFLLLTLPLVEEAIDTAEHRRSERWPYVFLVIVNVLGAVAKPALAIPLVPALPIYLVLVRRAEWHVVRRLVLCTSVPAGLIVFWQTWFLDSSDASEFSSGFTLEFIVDAPFGWSNVGWVFLFPFLLIALAAALSGRDYLRDRSVQLLLVCLAFAVPLMLFVNETGERAVHGNFAVPTQGCMTLLILVSVRVIASRLLDAWRSRDERRSVTVVAVVGAVALAFFAGGVLSLLDGIGAVEVPIDWLETI